MMTRGPKVRTEMCIEKLNKIQQGNKQFKMVVSKFLASKNICASFFFLLIFLSLPTTTRFIFFVLMAFGTSESQVGV